MSTIQNYIKQELLSFEIVKIDNKDVKVGLTYDEVLSNVIKLATNNPLIGSCKTTKNCITWYASHMRQANDKHYDKRILEIQRPKATAKKSTKVVAKK